MLMTVLIFSLGCIIHCLGDYFLKRASINFTWFDVLMGSLSYVVTIPLWLWTLRQAKLATLVSIGAAAQVLILALIGVVIFKEHMTTREICGLVLAVLAVAMFYK